MIYQNDQIENTQNQFSNAIKELKTGSVYQQNYYYTIDLNTGARLELNIKHLSIWMTRIIW